MPPLASQDEIALRREIGSRIRRLAFERGWNQSKLAMEASRRFDGKITRGNVSSWCRGNSLPGPNRAQALAKALGVPVTTFRPVDALENLRRRLSAERKDFVEISGDNGSARVRFDRVLPWTIAAQVLSLLKNGDADARGDDNPRVGGGVLHHANRDQATDPRAQSKTDLRRSRRS